MYSLMNGCTSEWMDMLDKESFSCEGCLRYTQAYVGACRSHSSASGSSFTGDHCHKPHPSLCQLGKSPPSIGSPVGMKVRCLKTWRGETAQQVEVGHASADRRQGNNDGNFAKRNS
ncbi:hypothetical protein JZ751_014108 [Albula glossodonta]|uniref:Uncharacterized protein n=1 Tax=Albula glossodonta TaxID=121402 RepID=A0A8T2NUG1_9TELE|nr:hypothetical protein JZ751_014108 [Albula glossodonta]